MKKAFSKIVEGDILFYWDRDDKLVKSALVTRILLGNASTTFVTTGLCFSVVNTDSDIMELCVGDIVYCVFSTNLVSSLNYIIKHHLQFDGVLHRHVLYNDVHHVPSLLSTLYHRKRMATV